jgi:glycerone phosphate O-acyltransferase/fatty acyl-CoA reductase
MVMELILDGKIDDIIIQPVTINYERVLEAETFPMELLGE